VRKRWERDKGGGRERAWRKTDGAEGEGERMLLKCERRASDDGVIRVGSP